jgi:alpha-D-ribose 1-methylphosphonate 5-triphosphate synthase subunit PhnH
MQIQTLDGGFATPPVDAAHAFRAIMTAMAQPGTIVTLAGAVPPAPVSVAAGVALLTLCDPETPLFLGARRTIRAFATGSPFTVARLS